MRFLVLCPHFEPDVAPTGVVMSAIVHELAELGHDVDVVTALPWYRHHRIEPGWGGRPVRRDQPSGRIRVTRVHPFPTPKGVVAARAAGFAGFTLLATAVAAASRPRPDAVLAMSPPITLGLAGWAVARRFKVPFVFNVQDIFPDAAVAVGSLSSKRLIAAARALEIFVYRKARAVTVLSEEMRANVAVKVGPEGAVAIHVIGNFVDVEQVRPRSRMTGYRTRHGLGDRTVVMYAGNIGLSQPLDMLVSAARHHQQRPDVVFVVNGEGSQRAALEDSAADLDNLVLVDFQPPELLEDVLATADIHVIVLRKALARSSVPSKLLAILAAGRAVVASVDSDTEIARVINEAGCGLAVPAEDTGGFIAAVSELIDDAPTRAAMGERGRSFVEGSLTPADAAAAYEQLLTAVAADAPSDR